MSRKTDYSKYLQSDEWMQKRDMVKETRKMCEICGSKEDLHVHHLTYENLYKEKDEDLLLLCKGCHFVIHKGFCIVIKNVSSEEFYNSELGNEVLDAFKFSKIKNIYFTKDKALILRGDSFFIEREDGSIEEYDAKKWHILKNLKE